MQGCSALPCRAAPYLGADMSQQSVSTAFTSRSRVPKVHGRAERAHWSGCRITTAHRGAVEATPHGNEPQCFICEAARHAVDAEARTSW